MNPKPYDPYDPWESSGPGPWESSGSWDWQSQEPNTSGWEISRPPYQPGEGDTGEKGDTWELPEWKPIQPPFTDRDAAIPPLPISPEYREPAFPDIAMKEGYPNPDLPGGEWPPPMPPPTQSSLKKGGAERAAAFDRLCPL